MTTPNAIHPVHLTVIILFLVTALICVLFIINKMRNKKGPKLLEKEKYTSTMNGKMVEIKSADSSIFNIWPYVSKLKAAKIVSNKIKERELIYKVYRDPNEEFEHILLATEKENNYVALIINRNKKKMIGYSMVDSNENYNLA